MGNCVFSDCTAITSISIPDSITHIGDFVFGSCTSLTSITLSNNIANIGDTAFYNCTELTSIILPKSVTTIDDTAFDGCTNLTIYCEQGSYAETYAKSKGFNVVYTDISKTAFDSKADNTDIEILKKLSVPHTTASGYPVSVSDHLEGERVIDYKVYGNSVQDGTPAPDSPIEIQSVGDLVTDTSSPYYGKYDVPVTVCGKNLLSYPYYDTTVTRNGITFTDNGDGTITVNGTATANTQFYLYKRFSASTRIHIMGNYRLSGCPSGGSYTSYTLTIDCFDDDENRYYLSDLGHSVKITEKNFSNICYIQIYKDTTLDNIVFKPQLELGSTATPYEPYSGETKHIYLDEPLRKAGDYADYVDWENQKVVRNVRRKAYVGSTDEAWTNGTDTDCIKSIRLIKTDYVNGISTTTTGLSNRFVYKFANEADKFYVVGDGNKGNKLVFYNDTELTIDEWKAQLATWNTDGHPLTVYYPLAAPIEETITAPDFTVPASEVMNISSGTSTPPSSMDAAYYQDINKVITNLTNAILAQGGNV